MPSGFFDPSQWLRLNQQAGQQMAGAVAGDVTSQGQGFATALDKAKADFANALGANPNAAPASLSEQAGYAGLQSQANAAQDSANLLGSNGGIQQALQKHYGGNVSAFDAAAAGYGNGGQFEQLQKAYGNLAQSLGAANTASVGQAQTARANYHPPKPERVPNPSAAQFTELAHGSGYDSGPDTIKRRHLEDLQREQALYGGGRKPSAAGNRYGYSNLYDMGGR